MYLKWYISLPSNLKVTCLDYKANWFTLLAISVL